MTAKMVIEGRFPGLNEYTAAQRKSPFEGNKMKRGYTGAVYYEAKRQLRGVHFGRPVAVYFHFVEKDKRRDLDNISGFAHKVILDGLVEAGVIKDDGWKYVSMIRDTYAVDKKRPRIEVSFVEEGT